MRWAALGAEGAVAHQDVCDGASEPASLHDVLEKGRRTERFPFLQSVLCIATVRLPRTGFHGQVHRCAVDEGCPRNRAMSRQPFSMPGLDLAFGIYAGQFARMPARCRLATTLTLE